MLTGWANDVALVVCGFAVGGMSTVVHFLAPLAYRESGQDWRKGEGLLEGMRRRADEQQQALEEGPRSFRLALYSLTAVIALVVLAIWFGPIALGWLFLLGLALGVAGGYAGIWFAGRSATGAGPGAVAAGD